MLKSIRTGLQAPESKLIESTDVRHFDFHYGTLRHRGSCDDTETSERLETESCSSSERRKKCTEPSSPSSRAELFTRHALGYNNQFRSLIDYQHEEKPRQLLYLAVLFVLLATVRYFLGHHPPRMTAVGLLATISIYCLLHLKDGLMVRPHPGAWRIIHGFGMFWFGCLTVFLILPLESNLAISDAVFPDLKNSHDKDIFEGTCDLDCIFCFRTVLIQLGKPWVICHIMGSALKMCVLRDWQFCAVNVFFFEFFELSLQWLIYDFRECWWDSLVLDTLTNLMGLFIGVGILRFLGSYRYDWVGGGPFYRKLAVQFMPFTWSTYDWSFFDSFRRFRIATILMFISILAEINAFLVMFAFDIPPTHIFNKLRVVLIGALSVPAVAELYQYANSKDGRLGHNSWLFFSIALLELSVSIKMGAGKFASATVPTGVWVPWFCAGLCCLVWGFAHFVVVGPAASKGIRSGKETEYDPSRQATWGGLHAVASQVVRLSPFVCGLPLLPLMLHYDFN